MIISLIFSLAKIEMYFKKKVKKPDDNQIMRIYHLLLLANTTRVNPKMKKKSKKNQKKIEKKRRKEKKNRNRINRRNKIRKRTFVHFFLFIILIPFFKKKSFSINQISLFLFFSSLPSLFDQKKKKTLDNLRQFP